MLKAPLRMSFVVTILIFVLVLGLGLGLGLGSLLYAKRSYTTAASAVGTQALSSNITIPQSLDLFEPFILRITPNTTVTWQNDDTVLHMFTTSPGQNNFLNPQQFSLAVVAGKSVKFTFTKVGLYHYYEQTLDTWDSVFSRVAANKGKANYPLAMDGVIWVQGPIKGLPTAAINHIPNGHDDFATEFLAISESGAVSWHNFDTDPHFFGIVPGWSAPINPVNVGLYRIAGTNDIPGGDTVTIMFNQPGLYYYYCRNHDRIDSTTHRAFTLTKASEYPLPMEGFVLVVGS